MSLPKPVVGVDGCSAGWVCARASPDGVAIEVVPDFEAVCDFAVAHEAERVLVDIPIGLSATDRRDCDREARHRLGSRASTVFFAPVRAVLDADSHADANARNRARCGSGLSIQAWQLVPKIRDVDSVLRARPDVRDRVFEAHPELVFAAFAGEPLAESKSTQVGRVRRLDLLRTAFPDGDPETVYRKTLSRTLRRDVARDDILDALALAVAARYPLETLPANPPRDAVGLTMAIHVPRSESTPE
ncbi:hypothetical protein C440_01610 [Haloferax mucosum ATCC BAA-1512]|uniref:DUF429 domain-containing protein n=1 Tax=Haloferax mucosum ATCC BAA-1512 TaxID=662479 RepID=M0ISN2_9EURY|nr:DUF429 domain-containing protein [Haloferax mucosum]ELZ99012.1 hypothetical protein C440_01610 [Haloferax mucosum ATCC BAA-1512]